MDLHEKVKALCKAKGMLFKELAKNIGITEIGLRQSLKGKPTLTTLEKIATALNVQTWELLITDNAKQTFVCPHCGKSLFVSVSVKRNATETAELHTENGRKQ